MANKHFKNSLLHLLHVYTYYMGPFSTVLHSVKSRRNTFSRGKMLEMLLFQPQTPSPPDRWHARNSRGRGVEGSGNLWKGVSKNLAIRWGGGGVWIFSGITHYMDKIMYQNYLRLIANFCVTVSNILSKEIISNNIKIQIYKFHSSIEFQ